MTAQALFYSIITGIFFGIWPLISRTAGLSTVWTAVTITTGTAIVVTCGVTKELQLPPTKSLLIGILAGLFSGFGLLTYGKLISNSSQWDMSITVPISLIITPMVIILGGWFFFHETITPTKVIGGSLGLVAIYLMCK